MATIFGLGGTELVIISFVMLFYVAMGIGFFVALYFAISKGIARGMRDGFAFAPQGFRQQPAQDEAHT